MIGSGRGRPTAEPRRSGAGERHLAGARRRPS